jgi:redox-sensitive bicupin YhaK (pirin superfamily)
MIHQDAALLGGRVEAGAEVAHVFAAGRGGYLVPVTGAVEINGVPAGPRDGVHMTREERITIRASEDTEVMLVDVAVDG